MNEPKSITDQIREMGERGKQNAERRAVAAVRGPEKLGVPLPIDPMVNLLPGSFLACRFGSPELAERLALGRPFAIDEAREMTDAPNVTLVGSSGSGKTSLMAAMVRQRHRDGRNRKAEIVWLNTIRFAFARQRHPLGENDPPQVAAAIAASLLVLDDVGSEAPIQSSPIPEVIFERYAENRATWITTWLDEDAAAKRYGDGFARRIFQRARIVSCG